MRAAAAGELPCEPRVNAVAGGTGDAADDGAIFAEEAVEEGGLAGVRAADDGDGGAGRAVWQSRVAGVGGEGIEQRARARAMQGRDGEVRGPAVGSEFGPGVAQGWVITFVDYEPDGLVERAEACTDFVVHSGAAGLCVNDEEKNVSLIEGAGDLAGDVGLEFFGVADKAAGIDQFEGGVVPFDGSVQAVAGGAARWINNSECSAGEAVVEGRLADVGAADDGDAQE